MLFLKKQVPFHLGGLTKHAMSVFKEKDYNFYFKGELADLVYMNGLLSEADIKALYESRKERYR